MTDRLHIANATPAVAPREYGGPASETAGNPTPSAGDCGRRVIVHACARPLCDLLGIDVPARSGGEVRVHPDRLRAPVALLPEARQYQIVHRPEGLLVRIVLREDAPHDFPDKAREAIGTALADADVRGRVEIVRAIEREPGPAAKVRLVRSDV